MHGRGKAKYEEAPDSRRSSPKGKKRPTPKNLIQSLMKERKVRGNYKDYVIIHAGSMLDHEGLYELTMAESGERVKVEAIQLFHKRELAGFMKPEAARLFWNSRLGVRVSKKARGDGLKKKEATGDRAAEAETPEQTAV